MAGLIRVLMCLVLLVGAAGALGLGAADALTEVGAGGTVVVAVFSTNADLAPEHVPVLREACGPRLGRSSRTCASYWKKPAAASTTW